MSAIPSLEYQLTTTPIEDITYQMVEAFCNIGREEDIDLDYKSDWPNDLDRVLAAFANTQGGIVIVGIEEIDKSRKPKCPPTGVAGNKDDLRQRVFNVGFDAIYPPVVPEVQVCPHPTAHDRSIVVIRVNPSRLMHAVDRRSRIYIRSADNNRGYKLASITDLEWLWGQRAKSNALGEQIAQAAVVRSNNPSIAWEDETAEKLWKNAPLLSVMLLPQFPGHQQTVELHTLMKSVTSIGTVKSNWKHVDRSIPWQAHNWRSIPGGVAYALRNGGQFQQYVELNEYGLIYSAFVIGANKYAQSRSESQVQALFIPAWSILANLDIALRFANKIYETTKYRIPLKLSAQLIRANGLRLNFKIPGQLDPFELDYLGSECPDEAIMMLDADAQSFELTIQHSELIIAATTNLFWAFNLSWKRDELRKWYEAVSK